MFAFPFKFAKTRLIKPVKIRQYSNYVYFKRTPLLSYNFTGNQNSNQFTDKRIYYFLGGGSLLLTGYYFTHLETVPSSGRVRFMSVTKETEKAIAKQAYQQIMTEFGSRILPQYHPISHRVRSVAEKLINVSGMEDLDWEVFVIASDEKNAFVLPGGKIFVFTGILNVTETDGMLAAVLGHEIAHQLARHSAEKLSTANFLMMFKFFLSLFMDTSFLFNPALVQFLFALPFSRKCESEADYIGLFLMANACYDPSQSVELWKRMSVARSAAEKIPEFMSTHPSSEKRIQKINGWLSEARTKYHMSNCHENIQFADMFRESWTRW